MALNILKETRKNKNPRAVLSSKLQFLKYLAIEEQYKNDRTYKIIDRWTLGLTVSLNIV